MELPPYQVFRRNAAPRILRESCEIPIFQAFGDKDGEREVLDRMIQMRAGLLTFKEIAKILNNDAVPTRMGKLWSEAVVAKILGRKR